MKVKKSACSWRGSNSRPSHFTAYMASQSHAHTAYKYDALTDCATGAGRLARMNLSYLMLRKKCVGKQPNFTMYIPIFMYNILFAKCSEIIEVILQVQLHLFFRILFSLLLPAQLERKFENCITQFLTKLALTNRR